MYGQVGFYEKQFKLKDLPSHESNFEQTEALEDVNMPRVGIGLDCL